MIGNRKTVKDVMTPLKQVLNVTDMLHLTPELARKLTRANFQHTWLMVRGAYRKEYWTSDQMKCGQTKVVGFVWCEDLISLCLWKKDCLLWQAARDGLVTYLQPKYIDCNSPLEECVKLLQGNDLHIAVVREYPMEVGLVSLEQCLGQVTNSPSKTPKESKHRSSFSTAIDFDL